VGRVTGTTVVRWAGPDAAPLAAAAAAPAAWSQVRFRRRCSVVTPWRWPRPARRRRPHHPTAPPPPRQAVDREAVADLIRAESARRARVTRAARLFMLWRRVNGQNDTAATAATTGATAALLGKGEFVFGPRCPYDLVSKILCYAAGTPLDDEIRELAGAAVSQEQLLGAQHPPLRSAHQGAPPLRTTDAAPHLLTQAALAAMSTQKLLLRLQVEKEKSARLRREQIGLEDEQRALEESIRACSLVRGVAASSPSPSPAARHGTGDLWVDQTLPPHVVAAAEVEVEAMIEGRL